MLIFYCHNKLKIIKRTTLKALKISSWNILQIKVISKVYRKNLIKWGRTSKHGQRIDKLLKST